MTFHVGQKVVCVDDRFLRQVWKERTPNRPVAGQTYTVRATYEGFEGTGIRLCEIFNEISDWGGECGRMEPDFYARRFRPLIERKTETGFAILKKICDDVRERERT